MAWSRVRPERVEMTRTSWVLRFGPGRKSTFVAPGSLRKAARTFVRQFPQVTPVMPAR